MLMRENHFAPLTFSLLMPLSPPVVREVLLVAFGFLFLALLSQVRIALPFTPVPITLQTLAVLLIALSFGSLRGGITVASYIVGGAVGIPIFAGGACGWKHLLGPTGGYLVGFFFATLAVGWLAGVGWSKNFWRSFVAVLIGTFIIYAFGALWLSLFVGFSKAIILGILPFMPGDLLKALITASILPSMWKVIPQNCLPCHDDSLNQR
jgi:biotin transport system substrate-specific component